MLQLLPLQPPKELIKESFLTELEQTLTGALLDSEALSFQELKKTYGDKTKPADFAAQLLVAKAMQAQILLEDAMTGQVPNSNLQHLGELAAETREALDAVGQVRVIAETSLIREMRQRTQARREQRY